MCRLPARFRVRHKKESAALAPSVTVTRVEPALHRTDRLRAKILDVLRNGPLSSIELHARCGARIGDRTFSRARKALEESGSITAAQDGRGERYSLAAA